MLIGSFNKLRLIIFPPLVPEKNFQVRKYFSYNNINIKLQTLPSFFFQKIKCLSDK